MAEAYERFRPGYPVELVDLVTAFAGRPVRTALEIGAGTGKATRLFAGQGVAVTATEPDDAMLAQLRAHVPPTVTTVRGALEEEVPSPDGTDAAEPLQWPGTELHRSALFCDVRQAVVERRLTMTADDYLGYLSTVSAFLGLARRERQAAYDAILQVLPGTVEIVADVVVHLARRREPPG